MRRNQKKEMIQVTKANLDSIRLLDRPANTFVCEDATRAEPFSSSQNKREREDYLLWRLKVE